MKISESERQAFITRKKSNLELDESVALARVGSLLSDVEGGTYEQGTAFVEKLAEKIEKGIPFTHSMIIFGEKFRDSTTKNDNIRADDTDFNRALVDNFGIEGTPHDVIGGNIVSLGSVGLRAEMECIWDPELSSSSGGLTDNERDGLRRHLYDWEGNAIPDSGVLFLPKVALRANLLD